MRKTDICRQYRTLHPEMPTLKLARIIFAKESLLFNSVEDARKNLRRIEGKCGNNPGDGVKITHPAPPRPRNPYKLPESYKADREPLRLPKLNNNILFLSDLHVPYHDVDAISTAIEYGQREKVNTIFINGDLLDFHHLSRFEKDPRKRRVKDEMDAARAVLQALRDALPEADIYWLYGNHDMRYEHWLMTKVHEIFDDPYYHLEQRLGLADLKVRTVEDWRLVKMGKLSVTHGHHVLRGVFAPVNSARGVYMKAKQSTIISHVHKVSKHSETDMDGNVVTTWSTGCLCELKPDYSPLVSNYQHGFAHITVEANGEYHVRNFQIIKGKIY